MATDLVGLTLDELETMAAGLGEPRYRGRQLARWIYRHRVQAVSMMSDLPETLRARLAECASLSRLRAVARADAPDGYTTKFLLSLHDGPTVETVLMRYDDGRRTACISTQVGCAMACTFCATGLAGLERNLSAGEIVDQVLLVAQQTGERPTHVVFMGMGEPLANYDATVRAVRLLNAPYGAGIGMRNLTISTVGLVPQIRRLAQERLQLTLAVSLHAPNDELRSHLVPVNRRWPVADLLDAARGYAAATGRRVTLEYVLMAGVNDAPGDADELARLVRPVRCKVNLIPFNEDAALPFRRPEERVVEAFRDRLHARGTRASVRWSRGGDVGAACGQLAVLEPG